ncbi:MAG TPA: 4-(cytidine 5'-diphospho)-2-C-methyl-D-erythritol kinase [Rhizobiales bacterium]|nr:4-(cytidine 5'-diphospho)-2-C-methyl-D-erythritol kinase [Hyphomicrobiales bacterium]
MTQATTKSVLETARAKINLSLHITGKRPDGYHLLDSLVVFADVSDTLEIGPAASTSLEISGPFGENLPVSNDNLVLQAFMALGKLTGDPLPPTSFALSKNLPVASGIGGGSADAGAALRGLISLWDLKVNDAELKEIALEIGADVPVCYAGKSCLMSGIGENLDEISHIPEMPAVLVNPGIAVSTAEIFSTLDVDSGSFAFDSLPELPTSKSLANWLDWIDFTRNDLEEAAISAMPMIVDVIAELEKTRNCQVTRMSGSGATCFGLYYTRADADEAAREIAANHPEWWVTSTTLAQS